MGSLSSSVGGLIENADVEEEYRSCCTEDEEWHDTEDSLSEEFLDQFSLRMFFKGVSVSEAEGLGNKISGIGVVMERAQGLPTIQVQKKLNFYVEQSVAEHLALMDGLLEALRNGVRRVFAYTDSEVVYDQIAEMEELHDPLLVALGQRIQEHADKLEDFVLKLVPTSDLERPFKLAQEAIGIVAHSSGRSDVLSLNRIHCPFPNCSVLLSPNQCFSSRASSSSQSDVNCIECPECNGFFCFSCRVPWHSEISCEEYQNLHAEERDADDISLHRLAQNSSWRRCQQCRRMIELTEGCYHMTCWCGHEFCFSCEAGYRNGVQTCQCVFWEDENTDPSVETSDQESVRWRWESFDSPPAVIDAYSEQERAQLALIQRFLAGGFSFIDHLPCQSPPRCPDSYVDTIKDLHQLPWLERFVSVISDDNYHEDFYPMNTA